MKKELIDRVNACADYMIETQCTIREAAKEFHVSKSAVHKDLQKRLAEINPIKYKKIAQKTLPNRPVKKAPKKENIPWDAKIPAVAKINSLGIIMIIASRIIAKNIPK